MSGITIENNLRNEYIEASIGLVTIVEGEYIHFAWICFKEERQRVSLSVVDLTAEMRYWLQYCSLMNRSYIKEDDYFTVTANEVL